jgi:hypothetical protein
VAVVPADAIARIGLGLHDLLDHASPRRAVGRLGLGDHGGSDLELHERSFLD